MKYTHYLQLALATEESIWNDHIVVMFKYIDQNKTNIDYHYYLIRKKMEQASRKKRVRMYKLESYIKNNIIEKINIINPNNKHIIIREILEPGYSFYRDLADHEEYDYYFDDDGTIFTPEKYED